MTKKIIAHIPILTALIAIIGMIKLNLYYQYFSIPIKNYIGLSEIAIAVADDLLIFLFFYVVTIAIFLYAKEISNNAHVKFFKIKVDVGLIKPIIFVVLHLVFLIWILLAKEYYMKIASQAFIYSLVFFGILQFKSVKDYLNENKDVYFVSLYFVVILSSVVVKTSWEIREVVHGKYNGTKIITVDTIYMSNDTAYYIGQTDKYVFFCFPPKGYTVIPTSTIKRIDIHLYDEMVDAESNKYIKSLLPQEITQDTTSISEISPVQIEQSKSKTIEVPISETSARTPSPVIVTPHTQ